MSGFLCETKLDRRRVVRCPCGGDLRVQLGLSITAQSYLLHQAKGRHCHNLHLTVWPACLHIGPLTSFHRCFSIRSTQQASIIQLRHGKAKVSLSGVTYKAAFFPHIRLGFGSTTTTAVAHISTRLYQHLCSHKAFTRNTYLFNLQAILVLRLDERPFKRENKTLLICRLLRAESTEEARRPMECRPGSDRPIRAAVSYSSVVGPLGQTQNTLRHVTIRRANYYSNVCEGMQGVV